MEMKNIIYESLCKEKQEVIKSLKNQIKSKNEAVLRESRRANEIFRLSYDRKLKLQEQQAEINRLRDRNIELFNELNYIACGFCKTADEAIQHARQALNGESEETK